MTFTTSSLRTCWLTFLQTKILRISVLADHMPDERRQAQAFASCICNFKALNPSRYTSLDDFMSDLFFRWRKIDPIAYQN